jgi:hypothetical protein
MADLAFGMLIRKSESPLILPTRTNCVIIIVRITALRNIGPLVHQRNIEWSKCSGKNSKLQSSPEREALCESSKERHNKRRRLDSKPKKNQKKKKKHGSQKACRTDGNSRSGEKNEESKHHEQQIGDRRRTNSTKVRP